MRLLIMGPPGAGKGTQAELIAEHYGIPAISTGDIFRAMQDRRHPARASRCGTIMDSGGYVSDEITNEIVADRLAQAGLRGRLPAGRLPADACSRSRPWTTTLPRPVRRSTRCSRCSPTTDEVVARLLKRAEIEGRADDNEETIRVRQQVYAEQTAPLLEVYRSRGLLVEVDGLGEIDEVSERVFAALDALGKRETPELVEPQ